MSPFEVFTTLISGAAHDVNHPGTNNSFEIKKGSDLAFFYNDTSVLENMHAAFFFSIINQQDCNIFEKLTISERAEARKTIIGNILATDHNSHHISILNDIKCISELP